MFEDVKTIFAPYAPKVNYWSHLFFVCSFAQAFSDESCVSPVCLNIIFALHSIGFPIFECTSININLFLLKRFLFKKTCLHVTKILRIYLLITLSSCLSGWIEQYKGHHKGDTWCHRYTLYTVPDLNDFIRFLVSWDTHVICITFCRHRSNIFVIMNPLI